MKSEQKKKKLLNFLDKKAFDPILNKTEGSYHTEAKKEKFRDVKRSTEKEKERFHNYNTPEDIKENFRRDLNSDPAKKVHRDLRDLDLPTLPELKDEFYDLCEELEV